MGVQTNSDRGMDVDMYIGGRQITCFNDIQGYHLIRDRFGLRDDFLDDTFSWDDFDRRAGVLCQKSYSLCGLYVVQRLTVSEHETMEQLGPLFCEHFERWIITMSYCTSFSSNRCTRCFLYSF